MQGASADLAQEQLQEMSFRSPSLSLCSLNLTPSEQSSCLNVTAYVCRDLSAEFTPLRHPSRRCVSAPPDFALESEVVLRKAGHTSPIPLLAHQHQGPDV